MKWLLTIFFAMLAYALVQLAGNSSPPELVPGAYHAQSEVAGTGLGPFGLILLIACIVVVFCGLTTNWMTNVQPDNQELKDLEQKSNHLDIQLIIFLVVALIIIAAIGSEPMNLLTGR